MEDLWNKRALYLRILINHFCASWWLFVVVIVLEVTFMVSCALPDYFVGEFVT